MTVLLHKLCLLNIFMWILRGRRAPQGSLDLREALDLWVAQDHEALRCRAKRCVTLLVFRLTHVLSVLSDHTIIFDLFLF